MIQTKCELNNCELTTKSIAKKQESLENGKVRFRLNIDVRKEEKGSCLNAIKTKTAFVKSRLSAQQPNVHLMDSLSDNWLKNNHISVVIIYYLRSLLVSVLFLRVLVF